MGRISIAAFMPKKGKEKELLGVIADRLPLLRRLGMATNREHILMRSKAGALIEVSEWVSDAAIEKAHHTPEVLALWGRFGECCEWLKIDDIEECKAAFPTFDAVE